MGRKLEDAQTRYFNNLVIDVIDVGIEASEAGAQIFNNMVAVSSGYGIRAKGEGAVVVNNIVALAADPIDVKRGRSTDNVVLEAGEIR
jgi:hypothetical protein